MRKLMILIIITAFFTACDKDDDPIVFPKSDAELIADEILNYKTNKATIYRAPSSSYFFKDIIFEIEVHFLIVKDNRGDTHYFHLNDLSYMYYCTEKKSFTFYFE